MMAGVRAELDGVAAEIQNLKGNLSSGSPATTAMGNLKAEVDTIRMGLRAEPDAIQMDVQNPKAGSSGSSVAAAIGGGEGG